MNTSHSKRSFTHQSTFTSESSVFWCFQFQNMSREQACSRKKLVGGFTLIEMVVSLGLFTIIMFITTSSLLAIVNADRNSRSVRIATDNLNVALEDMSRRIRTGSKYYCGETDNLGVGDCPDGYKSIFFDGQDGERVNYKLVGNTIMRSITEEGVSKPSVQVTAPEIEITADTGLRFFVVGSAPFPDTKQPIVVISLKGLLFSGSASAPFRIQTTITQRQYDN